MATFVTADICDAHQHKIENGDLCVLPPIFRSYGKCRSFCGPIETVKVLEDNLLLHKVLGQEGFGKVLFIDGGGSLNCALIGSHLSARAKKNGWAGIICNGCLRDKDETNNIEIGIRALATNPMRPRKTGEGHINVEVCVAGVNVVPGDWCYVDSDGILISKNNVIQEVDKAVS